MTAACSAFFREKHASAVRTSSLSGSLLTRLAPRTSLRRTASAAHVGMLKAHGRAGFGICDGIGLGLHSMHGHCSLACKQSMCFNALPGAVSWACEVGLTSIVADCVHAFYQSLGLEDMHA